MSLESRYRAYTVTRTVAGSSSVDEQTTTTFVERGFIQPRSGTEVTLAGGKKESYSGVLYTKVKTALLEGDTVTQDSTSWRVVYVTQPIGISAVNHHREVLLAYV